MKASRNSLVTALKWLLAACIIAWLIATDRLNISEFAKLEFDWRLGAVIGFLSLSQLSSYFRWYILVRASELPLSLREVLHIGLIASAATIFLPSTGGTEAVRMFYATPRTVGQVHRLITTLFVDRLITLLTLCMLGTAGAVVLFLHVANKMVTELALTSMLISLLIGFFALLVIFLLRLSLKRKEGIVFQITEALMRFKERKAELLKAIAISLLGQIAAVTAFYFGFMSLNLFAPIQITFILTPIVFFANAIPLTPMALGITDSVASFIFASQGISGAADVTMFIRVVTLIILMFCGIAYFFPLPSNRSKTEKAN